MEGALGRRYCDAERKVQSRISILSGAQQTAWQSAGRALTLHQAIIILRDDAMDRNAAESRIYAVSGQNYKRERTSH